MKVRKHCSCYKKKLVRLCRIKILVVVVCASLKQGIARRTHTPIRVCISVQAAYSIILLIANLYDKRQLSVNTAKSVATRLGWGGSCQSSLLPSQLSNTIRTNKADLHAVDITVYT